MAVIGQCLAVTYFFFIYTMKNEPLWTCHPVQELKPLLSVYKIQTRNAVNLF